MDIATISTIIAAISVVVGVIVAILQMRDANKTRKTGLIIQLNPGLSINPSEMTEAQSKLLGLEYKNYDDFKKKHGELHSGGEVTKAISVMGSYFEGMGFLLHRRLIDIDIVDYLTGGVEGVKMLWDKLNPLLEGYRIEYNLPKIPFQWFEYLYIELQKREQTLPQTQR